MSLAPVTFPHRVGTDFVTEVRQRVDEYFTSRGVSDKANRAMVLKTFLVLGTMFGAYGLMLTNWFTPLQMLGLCVVMGVGMAGTGFCVSHDALHGAYSPSPRVNALLGLSFDLIGANGYMWKITHNVIHHTYTNIEGIDEDLAVSPLIRLSPSAEYYWFHRFQHLFGFAAYALSTLFWVFAKDYKYFLQKDIGPYKNRRHPRSEIVKLVVTKLVYYGWVVVIPLLVVDVPLWQFAIGFLAMHFTAGFILGVVFQLAHVVEGVDYPAPDLDGNMEDTWLIHEMRTTSDFARRSRVVCWYVGGLNFQVEHHLFPKVCSIHYPAISPIVEAVATKHGVPYHQHDTIGQAVASHYRMLKHFARPPMAVA
ncbi:MAG TPA: acyl-CoA desaturase [Gemmatimonadales bacterium]